MMKRLHLGLALAVAASAAVFVPQVASAQGYYGRGPGYYGGGPGYYGRGYDGYGRGYYRRGYNRGYYRGDRWGRHPGYYHRGGGPGVYPAQPFYGPRYVPPVPGPGIHFRIGP